MEERKDGSGGMTSMIDVVFLLLIFFMCASKFRVPEGSLRAYLPKNSGPGEIMGTTRDCRIHLWVADQGEVRARIDERNVTSQTTRSTWYEKDKNVPAFDRTELLEHLIERRDNYHGLESQGLPVVIDFEKNVPVEHVVQILNLCHEAEIDSIGFAAPALPVE